MLRRTEIWRQNSNSVVYILTQLEKSLYLLTLLSFVQKYILEFNILKINKLYISYLLFKNTGYTRYYFSRVIAQVQKYFEAIAFRDYHRVF